MAANLIITPEARQDLDENYDWYEANQIGRGDDFLQRVDACILGILRNPEMHAIAFGNFRRALIRKFPYAIIYDYEAGTVTVYGVFHTSRDQRNWQQRLP